MAGNFCLSSCGVPGRYTHFRFIVDRHVADPINVICAFCLVYHVSLSLIYNKIQKVIFVLWVDNKETHQSDFMFGASRFYFRFYFRGNRSERRPHVATTVQTAFDPFRTNCYSDYHIEFCFCFCLQIFFFSPERGPWQQMKCLSFSWQRY